MHAILLVIILGGRTEPLYEFHVSSGPVPSFSANGHALPFVPPFAIRTDAVFRSGFER